MILTPIQSQLAVQVCVWLNNLAQRNLYTCFVDAFITCYQLHAGIVYTSFKTILILNGQMVGGFKISRCETQLHTLCAMFNLFEGSLAG